LGVDANSRESRQGKQSRQIRQRVALGKQVATLIATIPTRSWKNIP